MNLKPCGQTDTASRLYVYLFPLTQPKIELLINYLINQNYAAFSVWFFEVVLSV